MLVLKDVRPDGFTVPPWGVDTFETVKVIARTIARFHATSMMMMDEGFKFDLGQHCFLPADGYSVVEMFFKPGFVKVIEDLAKEKGFEEITAKILSNVDEYFKQFEDTYRGASENGYKVLCHGDFHSKNLLIRNGGRIQQDLLLVSTLSYSHSYLKC